MKLNKDKTENRCIKVGSIYKQYFMYVRNLGLILDATLEMEKRVNYICKSCYYQIGNIGFTDKYINDEILQDFNPNSYSFLTGLWQDYGNALL